GAELTCNDDALVPCPTDDTNSALALTLTSGQKVVIVVDGFQGSSGNFALHVGLSTPTPTPSPTPPCPQVNLGSTLPVSVSGTTVNGVNQITPASCGGQDAPDVTYLYTAPLTGTYTIDTCGSSLDTVLSVRASTCTGAELPQACNDDANALCASNGRDSQLTT